MLNKKLILKKTHDFCASKEPKITAVFIHGIATDSSSFKRALEYLEGTRSLHDIRFVAFDLLGSGSSLKDDTLEYDFDEQLEALDSAIVKLELTTPLVLVGHSMGTFIATRYASEHQKSVKQLVLISAPVYTEEDLKSPAMTIAIDGFKNAVGAKNRKILQEKAFNNSIKHIVLNKENYKTLVGLKIPTILIHGNLDQIIASFNYPKLLASNPTYLRAVQTDGGHGVSRDKYTKMVGIFEEILSES